MADVDEVPMMRPRFSSSSESDSRSPDKRLDRSLSENDVQQGN